MRVLMLVLVLGFLMEEVVSQSLATPMTTTSGGPYIMVEPGNQTVLEGQRVTFPCGTEGYPNTIVYTWFKDNVDIRTTDGYRVKRIAIQPDGSLLIKPAVKADKGWYTCRPSNGLGHDEASAYLNVVYIPEVLPMPTQITWAKGYLQQIDCPVDANPPLTGVIWVKDQNTVQTGSRFDVLNNGTLLVSNVQESDAGTYRCTPSNTVGNGIGSPRVQILVKDPPEIVQAPLKKYIRKVGDSVLMRCKATGTPAVSIQWIKVGGKLDPSSDRVTITDEYLEITDLVKSDHGDYECRAINTIATVVSMTELRIDNTTPHAPYNVTVIPGLFNVTISWEPAFDGGTPQHYVLWFRPITQPDWITIAVPGQSATSFNLFSLQPDTEYEFKILSRNSYGNGSFSEVVRQRTLGYDPTAVNTLPTNEDGVPFYPDIKENIGPQPAAPVNLTAQVKDNDILLQWKTPSNSRVPIFSYKIEYQHDNQWHYYPRRIMGGMSTSATMTDMPSGTYDIRLRSHGVLAYSPISNIVRVNVKDDDDLVLPEPLIGGIVGGILFLLVAVALALIAIFCNRRREGKNKDKKYNDVTYGKPDEMNGRHHEPTPKRDRWQHNGGGNFVTSQDNPDSIFLLPQTRKMDQSAAMRASLLQRDRDLHFSQRVSNGRGYDQDYGRQVPLTHETSFTSDRSRAGSFSSRPQVDSRNLTWPDQQHDLSFERQPLSRSLPPNYDRFSPNYEPSQDNVFSYEHPQHPSRDHPPLSKSQSFPSSHPSNSRDFPLLSSQYPSQSAQLPPSHPSTYSYHRPSYSSSQPSSARDPPHHPIANTSLPTHNLPGNLPAQIPSFQSEDDDVFRAIPHSASHTQPRGLPRHSSMKPGQTTYLTDDNTDNVRNLNPPIFGIEDISSVLDPSFEQQSQLPSQSFSPFDSRQPHSSHSIPPSSYPLYSDNDDSKNIPPGYYINTGDTTKPLAMVTPSQKHPSDNESSISSGRPLGYTRDHLQGVVQRLRDTPRGRSLPPPGKSAQQPNVANYSDPLPYSGASHHDYPSQMSQSHSNLVPQDYYNSMGSRDSYDDGSLRGRKAPYYMSDVLDEPRRPRAHSEGSRGMRAPSYSNDRDTGYYPEQPDIRDRHPQGAASYPDVSGRFDPTSRPGYQGGQHPFTDPYSLGGDPRRDQNYAPPKPARHDGAYSRNGDYDQPPPPLPPHRPFAQAPSSAPAYQREFEPHPPATHPFDPRDALPARYTSEPNNRYRDYPNRRYGDEPVTADSGSHSSGIGSRNTSQSTGSFHPHRRGSTGKGSTSFSSMQDPDLSSDMSGGVVGQNGGLAAHRRDTSGDENYEFDSIHALENDIMDDLRRYSQLSTGSQGGPENLHSSRGSVHQDGSYPHPSHPSRYPNVEQRFEKLREEFKQFRQQQHHPAEGIPPPPTAATALPIGMNGEPLYPMDSEML